MSAPHPSTTAAAQEQAASSSHHDTRSTLTPGIRLVISEMTALHTQVEVTCHRAEEHESRLSTTLAQLEQPQTSKAAALAQLERVDGEKRGLEEELGEQHGRVVEMGKHIEELDKEIVGLEAGLRERDGDGNGNGGKEKRSLVELLSMMAKENEKLKKRNEGLESRVMLAEAGQGRGADDWYMEKIEGFEKERSDLKGQLLDVKGQWLKCRGEKGKLDSELENEKGKITKLEKENKKMGQRMAKLEQDLEDEKVFAEKKRDKIKEQKKRIDKLLKESGDEGKKREQLETHVGLLSAELAGTEFGRVKEELQNLRDRAKKQAQAKAKNDETEREKAVKLAEAKAKNDEVKAKNDELKKRAKAEASNDLKVIIEHSQDMGGGEVMAEMLEEWMKKYL